MDWLTQITNWLKEQLLWIWNAIVEFFSHFAVMFIDNVTGFFAAVVESIPVPDWIAQYSMGALLANGGTTFAWIFGSLRIGEGLALIGLGYGFRLLRKLFTLGQW